MNVQDEIKALKERIAELEELAKEEEEFPQDGDAYWFIDDEGGMSSTFYKNYYLDIYRQKIGNIFRTEEEAEFAVKKLKVEAELRKFSRPFTYHETNWYLIMDFDKEVHYSYKWDDVTQGAIYFESEEKAKQAIQSIGEERIKKYIFEVE